MNTLLQLALDNDQHANGPGVGIGGIVFICVIIWLLLGGGGGKKN